MLAEYLKTTKPGQSWQQSSRVRGIYFYLLIIFTLILVSYIADIYILTAHEEQAHNYNNNVLILHEKGEYPHDDDDDDDPCHLNEAITNKIYIYDIPYFYREQPRKHSYKWIHGKKDVYDDPKLLNFAFWKVMNLSNNNDEYYHTHMHALEI